ncbi:MAG: ABC transporter permease [Gammaproteobacteria bacterium]|nr:ABC transporter permease [Gammaproteobacteria bacterium]MBU1645646.1 ABC transporter permease [Gammaproteobacteria bacterium]MBU1973552.1 ABC transporter permease [Gammaproteobacteria bacterium]
MDLSIRALAVWRRNFLVWRKLALPSILGNLADPMIYLFGLGYGLGGLLPQVGGTSYIAFLAAGTVCASTMNAASFEALYSAFSRLHVQKTWEAIMNAPVSLDDVVAGELLWAASKATLSGAAILLVIALLGLTHGMQALWVLPLIFLTGLAFAALGLCVTAVAPSYDFFMYYFTLFVTPMTLLSGVFFPLDQLPAAMQVAAQALPLTHAVGLARPLLLGQVPTDVFGHIAVLTIITVAAFATAVSLARRRLLK